jgi:hypothetical protein
MHHVARVMPALADACHLLPPPVLAPREALGTPLSCPRHLADRGHAVVLAYRLSV